MRLKQFYVLSVGLNACGASLPIDATPDWQSNNRYAIEMRSDCFNGQRSVGLGGCAFHENQLGGNLILPSLWSGNISFTSYNCNSFSVAATTSTDNILPIKSLYTAQKDSCSFQITRTISDGPLSADSPMIGRFLIKIIPSNKFYSKLKFAVNDKQFEGVGWFQHRAQKADADLTIQPSTGPNGFRGTIIIRCGTKEVFRQVYEGVSKIYLPASKINSNTCDYEILALNADTLMQEFATYMHEETTYTVDLNVPTVSVKNNKISFQFNDRDASGKKPVVVGVQVEQSKCLNTNKCTVPANKIWYDVKAITPSARMFYGTWNSINQLWEYEQW